MRLSVTPLTRVYHGTLGCLRRFPAGGLAAQYYGSLGYSASRADKADALFQPVSTSDRDVCFVAGDILRPEATSVSVTERACANRSINYADSLLREVFGNVRQSGAHW